jgi:hypothetical protein
MVWLLQAADQHEHACLLRASAQPAQGVLIAVHLMHFVAA